MGIEPTYAALEATSCCLSEHRPDHRQETALDDPAVRIFRPVIELFKPLSGVRLYKPRR